MDEHVGEEDDVQISDAALIGAPMLIAAHTAPPPLRRLRGIPVLLVRVRAAPADRRRVLVALAAKIAFLSRELFAREGEQ